MVINNTFISLIIEAPILWSNYKSTLKKMSHY